MVVWLGNPVCYLDLAAQLGLQYRALTGGLGWFPLEVLAHSLAELFDKPALGAGVWRVAQATMPAKRCCKDMKPACAACWTNSTEKALCDKWKGALPGCYNHRR